MLLEVNTSLNQPKACPGQFTSTMERSYRALARITMNTLLIELEQHQGSYETFIHIAVNYEVLAWQTGGLHALNSTAMDWTI